MDLIHPAPQQLNKISETATTSQTEVPKLGPRMAKVVRNKLANTLIQFRFSCPELGRIEEDLLEIAEDPDTDYISLLPIESIVQCLARHADNCMVSKKLYLNVVRDIELRSKHYRTWNKDNLYLTEVYVESFQNYVHQKHKN